MARRDSRVEDRDEPPDKKPFLLRLSPELMEDLRAWATHDLRSLNGHIEYLLREAVKRRQGEGGERSRKTTRR